MAQGGCLKVWKFRGRMRAGLISGLQAAAWEDRNGSAWPCCNSRDTRLPVATGVRRSGELHDYCRGKTGVPVQPSLFPDGLEQY